MNRGIFCISIDLELLWGRKDLDYSDFINRTKKERKIIKTLLRLFRKYNIPATWATVCKLYEKGGILWSGKDIINWIKKEGIHELGNHSYSHEIFSEISKKKAEYEIKKSIALEKNPSSFVFPRNKINHLELLKKYKFKCYRAKDKSEYELIIPRIPPTGTTRRNKGLVEIPSSMYFVSARGIKKHIPFGLRLLKSKLGIDRAISKGQIFHLWFHPVDFADNSDSLFRELEEILKYASAKRNESLLEIKTMENIL